jgi:hypothetical protein
MRLRKNTSSFANLGHKMGLTCSAITNPEIGLTSFQFINEKCERKKTLD